MTWEALTAIASLITTLVIAVTAIVAIVQIRHLRAASQLAAAMALMSELETLVDVASVRCYSACFSKLEQFRCMYFRSANTDASDADVGAVARKLSNCSLS